MCFPIRSLVIVAFALPSALWIPSLATAQSTIRISLDSAGAQANGESSRPSISADGRFIAYASLATNLVAADVNGVRDVFVYDRLTASTVLVSVDSSGVPSNGASDDPAISADGRFVAFDSLGTNLVVGDSNGVRDVFVHDLLTGATRRVSVGDAGQEANGESRAPAISAIGSIVAFESDASNLGAGDANAWTDVFVRDLGAGTTVCASVNSGGSAAGLSTQCSLSADGTRVAFTCEWALTASDTNFARDVYLRDLFAGTTTQVSCNSAGLSGNNFSSFGRISADGQCVSFSSLATNLGGIDTNNQPDIYERLLATGQTLRCSISTAGAQSIGWPLLSAPSGDGRYVVFDDNAQTLIPDPIPGTTAFLRDTWSGATTLEARNSAGVGGNGVSWTAQISADGRFVVFESEATNLVASDTNAVGDIFLRDRRNSVQPSALCFGDGTQALPCPCGNSGASGRGCENSSGSGGAELTWSGATIPDDLSLHSSGEPAGALTIFLQGTQALAAPVTFGDGLRCVGGTLRRLYAINATAGSATVPGPGQPSIGLRSLQLGDPLPAGVQRLYQAYYRDADASFCPAPAGNSWNVSNAVRVPW